MLFAIPILLATAPVDNWTARSDAAFKAADYCESFYYRSKVLELTGTSHAAFEAFNAAYQADMGRTALALYSRVTDPDERQKLAPYKDELEKLAANSATDGSAVSIPERTCPAHVHVCGDAIVEDPEQCDDGNVDAGDGCDSLCVNELAPETVASPAAAVVPRTFPVEAQVTSGEGQPPKDVDVQEVAPSILTTPPVKNDPAPSPLVVTGGVLGGVGFSVAAIAGIVGVVENSDVNNFDRSPDERKGAEDTRNISYVISGVAAAVGLGGTACAAVGFLE